MELRSLCGWALHLPRSQPREYWSVILGTINRSARRIAVKGSVFLGTPEWKSRRETNLYAKLNG